MMPQNRIAITGATGYLGSAITDYLSRQGHDIVALTRRPAMNVHQWRHFELAEPVDATHLRDVDVLIHAAWVLGGKDASDLWYHNVVGSRRLVEAAVAAKVTKIVFVSSMSAYFGTKQTYGLMKLAVERTVLDVGGVVLRPGLVYGERPGGMASTLQKVARLPLWPNFRSAKLFLAHQDDIAAAVAGVLAAYSEVSGHVLGLANPHQLDLPSILTALSRDHRRHPTISIPAPPVMAALRVLELANVQFPFRSDSLLGLVKSADSLPGSDLVARQGIKFRHVYTEHMES